MNLSETRMANIELVRKVFERGGIVQLAPLIKETGLTQVSCTKKIEELMAEGAVVELKRQASANRGRPIRRFEVVPNYRLAAEIILECESLHCAYPTSLHYRIVNVLGEVITQGVEDGGAAISAEKLYTLIGALKKKHKALKKVVVAFPGPMTNGIVVAGGDPHFDSFVGIDLKAEILSRFGMPSEIANDMNLAALGYYDEHAANLPQTFAYVGEQPNMCPGCGIVVDGKILEGAKGFAGEVKYLDTAGQKDLMLRLAARGERKKLAVRMIAGLTAVLNPAEIVLAGETFADPPFVRDIEKDCAAVLPAEVVPKLVVRDDWHADEWRGMFVLAKSIILSSAADKKLTKKSNSKNAKAKGKTK